MTRRPRTLDRWIAGWFTVVCLTFLVLFLVPVLLILLGETT